MPQTLRAGDWPSLLKPGMRVYAPGTTAESPLLRDALTTAPEAAAGVHFLGVWLPGINHTDYAGLHPGARATAFFIGRELRASFAAGRIDLMTLSYFEVYRYLQNHAAIDLAVVQTAPPDGDGRLSFGVGNDFTPAVAGSARKILAHVNPRMPRTQGAGSIALDRVDYLIEGGSPLLADDPADDPVWRAIGRHIATLVRDGDTIEVGIGRVQGVLSALTAARRLKLHTGAVTSPLFDLLAAGALAEGDGAVTCGIAFGSDALYRLVADSAVVRFAPVGETHDIATLRRIERFIAINGVIEVDLLGQANAETADGRQVSGAGGLLDFMRGARLSPGGLGIIALPATAGGGSVSRIVPALPAAAPVSVTRGDIDVVVTEHGIADLRLKAIDARAEALIAIAAPAHRDALADAWDALRRRM
jgi:acyl-CoA hydrolase